MTSRKLLTDRTLSALKPAAQGQRYVLYDSLVPPLCVRVSDKGRKTFIVYRRVAGHSRPVRLSLGNYPALSLEAARTQAKQSLEVLQSGEHPAELRERQKRAEQLKHTQNFATVAELFIRRHVSSLRTAQAVESAIRRELVGRWGSKPISSVTRRDVVQMLEEIIEGKGSRGRRGQSASRGGPYAARHVFAYTSKLFNWALARDLYGLQFSPCDRLRLREIVGSARPRRRVLTDEELMLVWQAADAEGYPFGTLTKLLLVTGQRLNEVAKMTRDEVNVSGKLWTLAAERTKGDTVHEVPLSTLALKLLADIPVVSGRYLLSTTLGERPVSGFAKAKERIDQTIEAARSRPPSTEGKNTHWQFHDLRRTMRTHLSSLPVDDMIRELVIGHRSSKLHQVYDQYAYREEKRRALQLWANKLRTLIAKRHH